MTFDKINIWFVARSMLNKPLKWILIQVISYCDKSPSDSRFEMYKYDVLYVIDENDLTNDYMEFLVKRYNMLYVFVDEKWPKK